MPSIQIMFQSFPVKWKHREPYVLFLRHTFSPWYIRGIVQDTLWISAKPYFSSLYSAIDIIKIGGVYGGITLEIVLPLKNCFKYSRWISCLLNIYLDMNDRKLQLVLNWGKIFHLWYRRNKNVFYLVPNLTEKIIGRHPLGGNGNTE